MRYFATVLVVTTLAMVYLPSHGKKQEVFTLRDAIQLALRHNVEIKERELDRISEKLSLDVSKNAFDLQYRLDGSVSLLNRNVQDGLGSRNDFLKSVTFTPEVSWKSAIGTSVVVNVSPGFSGQKNQMSSRLTITQPLLKGFGTEVNLRQLRQAYDREEQNRLNYRDRVSDKIVQIIKEYRRLIVTNNRIKTRKQTIQDNQRDVEVAKAKIKAGSMAPSEIYQKQQTNAESQLRIENEIREAKVARQQLLNTIGLNADLPINVPDDVQLGVLEEPDLDAAIDLALVNNGQYLTKLISARDTRRALAVAKQDTLWKLDLRYTGDFGGTPPDNGFQTMVDGRHHSQKVDLSFGIPIRDLSLKKSLVDAQVNLKKNEYTLQQDKRDLITKVTNEVNNINSQIKSIKHAQMSVELAKKAYGIEKKKQEIGRATALDINQSQKLLVEAQNSLISAKIDYLNYVEDLNLTLGTVLERWGITLKY